MKVCLTHRNEWVVLLMLEISYQEKKIDQSQVPILFAELETGQNGTLYKYPDEGVNSTT